MILWPGCSGISVHCDRINLQGNTTSVYNLKCELSRSLRENETIAWTFDNCTAIGNCDTGGCNGTIGGYYAPFFQKNHEYFLYNLQKSGTGPYLFSIHDLDKIIAQSFISTANVTDVDCIFHQSSTCHCVDAKNVSNHWNQEQNSSEETYLKLDSTTFRPTTATQNEYESDTTKPVFAPTNCTMILSSVNPVSTSSNSDIPIFVYAVIVPVVGIVLFSSICTCFIGCQMFKRGTFMTQTRFAGQTTIPDVDSELQPIELAHFSDSTHSPKRVSRNTVPSNAHNRESTFDFYEVPYAISDESNPPLPPRSSRTSELDFKIEPSEGGVQNNMNDMFLNSMSCNSELRPPNAFCSSPLIKQSQKEEDMYEEPYMAGTVDEGSPNKSSESDTSISQNYEILQTNVNGVQNVDSSKKIMHDFQSESIGINECCSRHKLPVSEADQHCYESTVPIFVDHKPLQSPPPSMPPLEYDHFHRNRMTNDAHGRSAPEAAQPTSPGEAQETVFNFPPDLEPDVASAHVYNVLQNSSEDEKR